MEEILKKDIFNDETLQKLSPDFKPSDLILRMQMRRSLVKDTHCYRIHKYNKLQKKQRAKSGVKVTQELLKLKNNFETDNLKNKLKLKNGNRKFKECKLTEDVITSYDFEEFDTNMPDIVINSLVTKSDEIEMQEQEVDINKIVISIKNNTSSDLIKSPAKIVTGINETEIYEEKFINNETLSHINKKKCEIDAVVEYKNKVNTPRLDNDMVGDLQSLFTQLAITSYSSEDDSSPKLSSKDEAKDLVVENLEKRIEIDLGIKDNFDQLHFLNITKIKPKIGIRERYLMRKYVKKWQNYVQNKVEQFKNNRDTVINNFFSNLKKKKNGTETSCNKSALLANDYNRYQHRYKVQKNIIAFQKAKLEEQNRIIEELKYNKIIEASKESVDAMKEEVRKTYYELDRHLKPKIKYLTNELKIPEIEEPALILHCLKVPQFLQRMEKRAREREEKHALIRERRRQIEEEKVKMKQQAELAKAEMDKEEKARRLKELKEKRRKEKIEAIRKKEYAEKMRALNVMADLHYEKTLLTKYGMEPWKMLIEIKKMNMERAKKLRRMQLMRRVFLNWAWYTDDQVIERNFIATEHYRKKTLKKYFIAFKTNHRELQLKKQVAEDFYDFYVMKIVFGKFREAVALSKVESQNKMETAIAYYNSNLKFKTLSCWRTLPAINKLLQEQDVRKARWRQKVLEVLPDFLPPED